MTLLLLVLLLAIIAYTYCFMVLKKDLKLMHNIQKSKECGNDVLDTEGYLLCIEDSMILDDFYFYKDIIKAMPKNQSCKVISFNISEEATNVKLMEGINLRNIPSIMYINKQRESKEIFNFNDLDEHFGTKDIIKLVTEVLKKNKN
ncbi:hypothetical protein [Bacillus cereus]|uniref:Uncharacterized protein n=1 Tax=Bacillus cereus TaxID=1396 RepID=A0AA44Q6D2_BACCE|nr:hypothetical protein [Bacillus cereus]PFN00481.1 hypothetical protein COJ55_25040 [Bacillus cereus]PFR90750.1 hypothetical protein COK38_23295 [Bacillus cereus]